MVTSNQLSIHATPTTEDDGWVEGDDDSQGEISSQEELEEAYEGSQWEDDIESNEFEEATDNDDENDNDENDDELVECEDGSLVETEELCEQSEALVTCSDGSSAATQAECPPEPEPVSSFVTCSDGSSAATQAECPAAQAPTTLVPPVGPENSPELKQCSDGTLATSCQDQIFTCSVDGSTVTGDEKCSDADKPNPYCDTPAGKAASSCHDRFDTDENGIATCNDGTDKKDPLDCKDATENKNLPRCQYKVYKIVF